ncbi:NAA35 family protein [Megaselia abdita]
MSAIEMMDPKMDVGMGFTSSKNAIPHTFDTALEAGILKLVDLESSELIGVFDALYSCVVSWLEGLSLDQILFTCLYLHNPMAIEDKSLKVFCIAIRKLVTLINQCIAQCNVNEEEDFQLFVSSNYNFFPYMQNTKIIQSLKEAEDDLVKKAKTQSSPLSEGTLAVMHRLRFLRFLFHSLHLFQTKRKDPIGEHEIAEIQKILSSALEVIPLIQKTISKGTQPEENSEAPNPMGFSPRVNQRNVPPTFPRTTKIVDRETSLKFLEELVHRLKLACKVIYQKDFHSALNFFLDFSKKSGQCLLSRSILQNIFFGENQCVFGSIPFKDFLRDSIKLFIAPPALNSRTALSNHPSTKIQIDNFLTYCMSMHTFVYFLQICGFNRARQRDKFARLIEDGFVNVQEEAARLDAHFNTIALKGDSYNPHMAYFGTWNLYHCLKAMSLYLLSGFELELYSVHEYLYIFWYLYEYLFGFIITALKRAESIVIEQEQLDIHHKSSLSAQSKQRKPKIKKHRKNGIPFRQEIFLNTAYQNICGGYYKAIGAFTKEDKIRQPLQIFDSEYIRFNHRFAPFATLTSPPPIPYHEFDMMRKHLLRSNANDLYISAATHFHEARLNLEYIQNPDQEVLQMIQVAKVNYVVMSLLAKGHKRESKSQPVFDYSQHRYFPVIKLN